MARWTQSYADAAKMATVSQQMPFWGIVVITTIGGATLEGLVQGLNIGNNAGAGGVYQYYGECTIQQKDRTVVTVDFLDIANVVNVWNAKAAEYEQLGLIKIIP